jgi:hypothetical protein
MTSSPSFDPLLLGQADATLVGLENGGPEATATFTRVMAGA